MDGVRIGIDVSGLKANLWFSVATHWGLDIRACATKDGVRAIYCVGTPHINARGPISTAGDKAVYRPVLMCLSCLDCSYRVFCDDASMGRDLLMAMRKTPRCRLSGLS